MPAHRLFRNDAELADATRALRAPFALKVISAHAIYKSDVGGVRLDLNTAEEVATALAAMRMAVSAAGVAADAWLLEEMVPSGLELVVGGMQDAQFGPMVMVGFGGVFVEIIRDVGVRICPVTSREAREMINSLQGAPLLRGARGRPAVDVEAIVQVLLRIGGPDGVLMQCADAVTELDINPLIVTPDGAFAADARFILRRREPVP